MFSNRNRAILGALMGLALLEQDKVFHDDKPRTHHPKPTPNKPIPNGCKEYTIQGIKVVAISEKSAIKKVAKILKINE